MSIPISQFNQDAELSSLLSQLDNGDGILQENEVDSDHDRLFDRSPTTQNWTRDQFQRVENIIYRAGLIESRREPVTVPVQRLEVTELPSRSGRGQVTFIRQFHRAPIDVDRMGRYRDAVSNYQLEILRVLLERRPRHIFDEGRVEDIPPGDMNVNLEVAERIRAELRNGIPENPSDLLRTCIYQSGAAYLYRVLDEQAHVHATSTLSLEQRGELEEERFERTGAWDENFIFPVRERYATAQVMRFVRTHRQESVFLIFGANHKFRDDFLRFRDGPGLQSISFPEMIVAGRRAYFQQTHGSISTMIVSAEHDNARQMELIISTDRIQDWVFEHLHTEEAQLEALGRLELRDIVWPRNNPSCPSLRSYLLQHAASESVRVRIGQIPRDRLP